MPKSNEHTNVSFNNQSLPHLETKEIKSSIFFFSKSIISCSVGGGGIFFGFASSFFLIYGPLFKRFGESLITVIPPNVSPNKIIGSVALNAKFVSFGFLTGFLSAKLLCFSTFKS